MISLRSNTANRTRAFLEGASFEGASLRGAPLPKSSLQGGSLSEVINLTQAQIEGAHRDESTKLPSHLKPPRTGT
jgi:uncharacterized protein YjbI with pentapeptide repeats